MIYVYVLRSEKDGLLYTGCTRDLRKRLDLHNGGRWHRRPNGGRSASFTTKAARTNKTHFAGKNILKARTGSVISRHAAGITSRAKEGFERKTPKDFAHFLDLAKGSCGEVRSMLYVAEDLKYLTPEQASQLRGEAEKLSRGIAAFTSHLRA